MQNSNTEINKSNVFRYEFKTKFVKLYNRNKKTYNDNNWIEKFKLFLMIFLIFTGVGILLYLYYLITSTPEKNNENTTTFDTVTKYTGKVTGLASAVLDNMPTFGLSAALNLGTAGIKFIQGATLFTTGGVVLWQTKKAIKKTEISRRPLEAIANYHRSIFSIFKPNITNISFATVERVADDYADAFIDQYQFIIDHIKGDKKNIKIFAETCAEAVFDIIKKDTYKTNAKAMIPNLGKHLRKAFYRTGLIEFPIKNINNEDWNISDIFRASPAVVWTSKDPFKGDIYEKFDTKPAKSSNKIKKEETEIDLLRLFKFPPIIINDKLAEELAYTRRRNETFIIKNGRLVIDRELLEDNNNKKTKESFLQKAEQYFGANTEIKSLEEVSINLLTEVRHLDEDIIKLEILKKYIRELYAVMIESIKYVFHNHVPKHEQQRYILRLRMIIEEINDKLSSISAITEKEKKSHSFLQEKLDNALQYCLIEHNFIFEIKTKGAYSSDIWPRWNEIPNISFLLSNFGKTRKYITQSVKNLETKFIKDLWSDIYPSGLPSYLLFFTAIVAFYFNSEGIENLINSFIKNIENKCPGKDQLKEGLVMAAGKQFAKDHPWAASIFLAPVMGAEILSYEVEGNASFVFELYPFLYSLAIIWAIYTLLMVANNIGYQTKQEYLLDHRRNIEKELESNWFNKKGKIETIKEKATDAIRTMTPALFKKTKQENETDLLDNQALSSKEELNKGPRDLPKNQTIKKSKQEIPSSPQVSTTDNNSNKRNSYGTIKSRLSSQETQPKDCTTAQEYTEDGTPSSSPRKSTNKGSESKKRTGTFCKSTSSQDIEEKNTPPSTPEVPIGPHSLGGTSRNKSSQIFSNTVWPFSTNTSTQSRQKEELVDNLVLQIIQAWNSKTSKSRSSSIKNLQRQAKQYGYKCQNVNEDGNCFFHAVAEQLKATIFSDNNNNADYDHAKLRKIATDHILKNISTYQNFTDMNMIIDSMTKSGTWVEETVVVALARELNINIIIIRSDGAKPNIIKRPNAITSIFLGYEVGQHYQTLIRDETYKVEKNISKLIDETEFDDFTNLANASDFTLRK